MTEVNDNVSIAPTGVDSESYGAQNNPRRWATLPNYLTVPKTKGGDLEEMADDVFEEENELGGGRDSDIDCAEVDDLNEASELTKQMRLLAMTNGDDNTLVLDTTDNMVLLIKGSKKLIPRS